MKVHHEENPIDDCPKVSVSVWTRHKGQKVFTGYQDCGGGLSCTRHGLQEFIINMPWSMFFHQTKAEVPSHILAAAFQLDMWHIRRCAKMITGCGICLCHLVLRHASCAGLCCAVSLKITRSNLNCAALAARCETVTTVRHM